jgi:mRNA interferase RelE/StbE
MWALEFTKEADKKLDKLDTQQSERIVEYLKSRVAKSDDPRLLGKALSGELVGLWRYRVGDYRIICKIEDEIITILVIEIGHRREIYR